MTRSSAMERAADVFARRVERAPDRQLARLLASPARRAILELIVWRMPRHLDRERAGDLEATVEWRIGGRPGGGSDVYRLSIAKGRSRVTRGPGSEPATTTVELGSVEFLKLVTGNADPIQAFLRGDLAIKGEMQLAAGLLSLFRIPSARREQPRHGEGGPESAKTPP